MRLCSIVVAAAVAMIGSIAATDDSTTDQLQRVRGRISSLEQRLGRLDEENRSRQEERERLSAELELAEARVREIEIVLERNDDEAQRVEAVLADVARRLDRHRALLAGHVELVALLGRPGALQLFLDGSRGGDLERAVSTVAVLTNGQLRLVRECDELYRERSSRLAELSRILAEAETESVNLARRQDELVGVRQRVDSEIDRLNRSQRATRGELEELRQREQALERLMATLGERRPFTARDDIRAYRGALPWPARGPVVRGFGRKYLPKYSTYTVCNGLRLDSPSGSEVLAVFPGEVAYARFFKGYGNMVVLDHGHDVYSLAAGLATIHVRVNQRVDMGLRLGLASPPSEEGNTYFEIRVGKKPQDPTRWLSLR